MLGSAIKPHTFERIRGTTLQNRRKRLLSANPLCVHCQRDGRVTAAVHLDHIVPLWQGGPDTERNLQGLCVPCHAAKSADEARQRGG